MKMRFFTSSFKRAVDSATSILNETHPKGSEILQTVSPKVDLNLQSAIDCICYLDNESNRVSLARSDGALEIGQWKSFDQAGIVLVDDLSPSHDELLLWI